MKLEKPQVIIAYIFVVFLFILIIVQLLMHLSKYTPDGDGILLAGAQFTLPFLILYFTSRESRRKTLLILFSIITSLTFLVGIANTSGEYVLTRKGIFHILLALCLPFAASILLFAKRKKVEYYYDSLNLNRSIHKYATRNDIDDFNNTELRKSRLITNQDWYVYGFLEGVATMNFFCGPQHSEQYRNQFLSFMFGDFKSLYGFQISKLAAIFTDLRNNPDNRQIDLGVLIMVAALKLQGQQTEPLLNTIRHNLERSEEDHTAEADYEPE